jgi:biopolymer transport protein ExbB
MLRLGAVLTIGVLLMVSRPVFAQTDASGELAPTVTVRYFDFFVLKGGWIAYLIMVLSVVAVALTIEHCLSIRRCTVVPLESVERVKSLIQEKKYEEVVRYTAEEPSMLGYVLHAAFLEAPNGYAAMERALEEAIEERSAKLYRKIEYLNIIGAVSPMIGLIGTVVGMILLFSAIHAADAFPRAQVVADNVAVALIATFWGLAVAIPSLSVYSVFRNRIEVMTAECALAADGVLAAFKVGTTVRTPPRIPAAPATTVIHGN